MKLILREYLSSLRERDELDVIFPDLLSQLGLNVYSRPGRGTRQDGVDVGAVGKLDGKADKVYLFSIKAGDLTRKEWDGDAVQSLRPSLNEILDSYIPSRLPAEHRDKDIVICIGIGGDIQEQVRTQLTGYIEQNTKTNITFEEWNGDKLASLIQSCFLREDLLPTNARSHLRKSLALIDEPEASYKHFLKLIKSISEENTLKTDADRIIAIRQMGICLWVLFAWSRDANNLESAYLSSEITLLHAWEIFKIYENKKTKSAIAINTAFQSIVTAYSQICNEFHTQNTVPHVAKLHGMSSAIHAACSLDINLKLFDILGRIGTNGIWAYWGLVASDKRNAELQSQMRQTIRTYIESVKSLISNNPALLLPIKDDQAIDISIALCLLLTDSSNFEFIKSWIRELIERASFSYNAHGNYPCNLISYSELLDHPKHGDEEYRKNVTGGSILYPTIALIAALLDDDEIYGEVAKLKEEKLKHCNFQLWYPDDTSEDHFYTNTEMHGAVLSRVGIDRTKEEYLAQIFDECDQTSYFNELSAVKSSLAPILLIACRHYRIPLPPHFFKELKITKSNSD